MDDYGIPFSTMRKSDFLERYGLRSDPPPPTCLDHDEDCDDVKDKVHCWLYQPARGMCPFLRSK